MKLKSIPLIAVAVASAATAVLFSSDDKAVVQNADTIYHGGSIITIVDANPRAEAVAVKQPPFPPPPVWSPALSTAFTPKANS